MPPPRRATSALIGRERKHCFAGGTAIGPPLSGQAMLGISSLQVQVSAASLLARSQPGSGHGCFPRN
jgi:hypothetical protein